MSLPAADQIDRALHGGGIVAPGASLTIEVGSAAAIVRDGTTEWIVREVPPSAADLAGITVLTVDHDVDLPSDGPGIAIGHDGWYWRLDDEEDAKGLLGALARAGAADAMAIVLALFQTQGRRQRPLLDPPLLVESIGLPPDLLASVHGPRLTTVQDNDWTLTFWTLAAGPLRSNTLALHRWNAQSTNDETAWWSRPEWTNTDG